MGEWLTSKCGIGLWEAADDDNISPKENIGRNEVCRMMVILSEAKAAQKKP